LIGSIVSNGEQELFFIKEKIRQREQTKTPEATLFGTRIADANSIEKQSETAHVIKNKHVFSIAFRTSWLNMPL